MVQMKGADGGKVGGEYLFYFKANHTKKREEFH